MDCLSQLAAYAAVGMLLLLSLLVFASVVARYGFNRPIGFTDEVSGYLSVSLIFFGLAYTLKENGHIRVEIIVSRLSPRLTQTLQLILIIVGFAWAVPLAFGVWQLWFRYFDEEVKSWGGLQIPLWIPSLTLVIGAVLLLLQLVVEFLKSRRGKS